MAVVRPPITGDLSLDSWTNQVTQHINTDLGSAGEDTGGTGAASVGPAGTDAPHYAEITLFTDPAVSSAPSAPTATMTWTTVALSSVTAGWSQISPTVDPASADSVYSSKIIFIDTVAPFTTTTETGSTPVKSINLTGVGLVYVQDAQPTSTNPYLWVQTNVNTDGDFSFWFTD